MHKYKITVIDQYTGVAIAEIIESPTFPTPQDPLHYLKDGRGGIPIRVERVIEADYTETLDLSSVL